MVTDMKAFTTIKLSGVVWLILYFTISQNSKAQNSFWEEVKGPYAGSFWAAGVMSDGTYFTGTGDGKIFRKLKGEDIWKLAATSRDNQTILSFNEYNGKVYAGDANGGVLVSDDNGENWSDQTKGIDLYGAQIRSMLVTPSDFLLGTGTGIYKQVVDEEKNISWQALPFNSPRGKFVMSLAIDVNGILYAGTGSGVFKSIDNGQTWNEIGFYTTGTTIFSVSVKNEDVYIGTSNGIYVHYASAGDKEWKTLAKDITHESFSVRNVSVINGRVYMSVTGVGTYYSDDDTNWTQLPYTDARAGFFKDGNKLVIGTDNGLWTSSLNDPLADVVKEGAPEGITFLDAVQSRIFAVARYTVLYEANSPRSDNQWNVKFRVHSEGAVKCYAEKPNGTKFINLIGAATGAPLFGFTNTAEQTGFDAVPFPSEVARQNQYLVTSKDSVLIATNAGLYFFNSKTHEIKRLSKVTTTGKEILELTEDDSGLLYASTIAGLYVSADDGKTWSVSKITDTKINALLVTSSGDILIGTDKALFHLNDLDSEPEQVDGFINVLSFEQDKFGHLYMVADGTVYYSEDSHSRWTQVSERLSTVIPYKLRIVDNYIYLATSGGLFKHLFAAHASVSLSGLGSFTYDGIEKKAIATTVPAGLEVELTYNKNDIVPLSPGLYRVRAVIRDDVYVGESSGIINIGGMPAEVSITAQHSLIFDGDSHAATATTDPQGLNVRITYNDLLDFPVNAGKYIIKATISSPNYSGYSYDTMYIDKAQQEITFDPVSEKLTTDEPFALSASTTSGLPVRFNVSEGPATVEGNMLTLNGQKGTITVNAVQDGDMNFYEANTVSKSFNVWENVIAGAENPIEKKIHIYPIPSRDKINVQSLYGNLKSVVITDALGRVIERVKPEKKLNDIEINVNNYPPGILMVHITIQSGENITRRIEVIR
jgi:ligand-binding sensor domain-containing protein